MFRHLLKAHLLLVLSGLLLLHALCKFCNLLIYLTVATGWWAWVTEYIGRWVCNGQLICSWRGHRSALVVWWQCRTVWCCDIRTGNLSYVYDTDTRWGGLLSSLVC